MARRRVYEYGMRNRGFSPGCQPMRGFIERKDDIFDEYKDVLVYDRPLGTKELEEYELDYLGDFVRSEP